MDKRKDKVVRQFVAVVRGTISPCRIILFGSRAKGVARKDSDYDFLLISPVFTQWEFEERGAKIYRLKREIPAAMDILCYTPAEFEQKKQMLGIVQEAVKRGVEV